MNWKNLLFTVSFLVAIVTGVALWETETFSKWGTLGIVIGLFVAPNFLFKLYALWENREQLKHITDVATMQMAVIKQAHREKKRKQGGKK